MKQTTRTWSLDPSHSEVEFKIKHMLITNVTGHFNQFASTVETNGDDFSTAKISFTANIDSVDTNSEARDGHLKGEDFFNSLSFPQLKFESSSIEKKNDEEYILKGNLTIRDITKPVQLAVQYGGMLKDGWGNLRAGFEVTGKIRRKEFGLKWDALTETGGAIVSDEVRIHCNVQYITPAEVKTEEKREEVLALS